MIKKTIKVVLVSILLTYSFNVEALAGNTKYKAIVKKVKNKVEFKYENEPWNDIKLDQVIIPITSIRTGALSRAEIMFSDGTITRIGSRTFFTVLDKKNRAVNVKVGRVWFNVKKKSDGLKIYSPDAVAAITGTEGFVEFSGNIDPQDEIYVVQTNDTVDKIAEKLLGNKSVLSERNKFIKKLVNLNPNKIKKNKFLYSGDKLVVNKVNKITVDKSNNYFAFGLIEGTSDIFKSNKDGEATGSAQKVKEGELLVLKGGNFSIQNIGIDAILEKYGDKPKDMIEIKGGSFQMGGDGQSDEKPIHKVTVGNFYIGKYEVTQKDYKAIIGKNPSSFVDDKKPVENISWWDAIKYCNKKSLIEKLPVAYNENTGQLLDSKGNTTNDVSKVVGYRLPIEAEWEYASRGGNKSKGYNYSGSNSSEEVAWFGYEKIDKKTYPVGTKKANELGIFDMSGNVSEWVSDIYISDAYSKTKNNINPYFSSLNKMDNRVYRGGSWNYIEIHQSVFDRSGCSPDYKGENIGFRIVRTIIEE